MTTARAAQSASITAENEFTTALHLDAGQKATVSISGTFSATVTLQRQVDGTNWRDVRQWTAAAEEDYEAGEGQDIRLGVKTGDFTSGTVAARLGTG